MRTTVTRLWALWACLILLYGAGWSGPAPFDVSGNALVQDPTDPTKQATFDLAGNTSGQVHAMLIPDGPGVIPGYGPLANMPSSPINGQLYTVTDGASAGSCTTGGLVYHTLCQWSTATAQWAPVSVTAGVSTLQEAFVGGQEIITADSEAHALIVGDNTHGWKLWGQTTGSALKMFPAQNWNFVIAGVANSFTIMDHTGTVTLLGITDPGVVKLPTVPANTPAAALSRVVCIDIGTGTLYMSATAVDCS